MSMVVRHVLFSMGVYAVIQRSNKRKWRHWRLCKSQCNVAQKMPSRIVLRGLQAFGIKDSAVVHVVYDALVKMLIVDRWNTFSVENTNHRRKENGGKYKS